MTSGMDMLYIVAQLTSRGYTPKENRSPSNQLPTAPKPGIERSFCAPLSSIWDYWLPWYHTVLVQAITAVVSSQVLAHSCQIDIVNLCAFRKPLTSENVLNIADKNKSFTNNRIFFCLIFRILKLEAWPKKIVQNWL